MRLIFALIASIGFHTLGLQLLYSMPKHFGGTTSEGRLTVTLHDAELSSGITPRLMPLPPIQYSPGSSIPTTNKHETRSEIGEPTSSPLATMPLPITTNIYFPRDELTLPPTLIENVDLSSLAKLAGTSAGRALLELYINEQGSIDRVEPQSDGIPDNILENLRDLLFQLKFSGGEIDGTIVKTRLVIEVLFIPTQRAVGDTPAKESRPQEIGQGNK